MGQTDVVMFEYMSDAERIAEKSSQTSCAIPGYH